MCNFFSTTITFLIGLAVLFCFSCHRHAICPPSTSRPSIQIVDIAPEMRYLMVMSDGVYKSIEAAVDEAQTIGVNQVLANMVHACSETPGVVFSSIAQTVLEKVAHLHEEAYQRSREGILPHIEVREDMTLAICKFGVKVSPSYSHLTVQKHQCSIITQGLHKIDLMNIVSKIFKH